MEGEIEIAFRPVGSADVAALARWLSLPHVRPWFYGGGVDESFVAREYEPVFAGSTSKRGFIIVLNGVDAGYAETYLGHDHEKFFTALNVDIAGTAGCDLLIGDLQFVGRGFGALVIRKFTDEVIFTDATVVRSIAGPDRRNERSQRAFAQAGYQALHQVQVPSDEAPAIVMQAISGP